VPDLRSVAEREVGDLLVATRLAASGKDGFDGRPVIARIRRRGRRGRVWGMRLSFADGSGHVRWTTLVGVTAYSTDDRLDIRRALDLSNVRPYLDVALPLTAAALAHSVVPFASSAIARDEEILAVLRATRARLVPRTPRLFDRRDVRETAAQLDVLADAVHRCEEHHRRFGLLQQLTFCASELVFAVAFE
jgi:hypothetical protein